MERSFDLLEQIRHAIEAQARALSTEIAGDDPERFARSGCGRSREAPSKRLVDNVAKRTTGPTGERL